MRKSKCESEAFPNFAFRISHFALRISSRLVDIIESLEISIPSQMGREKQPK